MKLRYSLLGRMGYREAAALQERVRREVLEGGDERLLLVEHEPVVTLGRSAREGDILDAAELSRQGVAVEPSSRGGQVTYHGPGQLVAYAILRIQSVVAHVEALCGAAVAVAASLGVPARFRRDCPGVWVGDKKLASIGVHVHKKVTLHGLSLNVSTALEPFQLIRACGSGAPPTSLALESGRQAAVWEVAPQYAEALAARLGRQPLFGRVMRVVVLHNRDAAADRPDVGDVVNAARDVGRALAERGCEVATLAVEDGEVLESAWRAVAELRALRPELVFNLCESLGGDARNEVVLPTLMELAGLRYTGSGPLALGLALRKELTKKLLVAEGVSTPEAVTLPSDDVTAVNLPFPLIVKPTREDASVGISNTSVVHDQKQLEAQAAAVWARFGQPLLVERYIEGRELYVSLIGAVPEALPLHEIDFSTLPSDRPRIVSYLGKWDPSSVEYQGTRSVKCEGLAEPWRERCVSAARAAFLALGLRDYGRVDVRLAPDGTPYVIDVNPNCDLSDGAGVSRAASFAGLGYGDLIWRICQAALERSLR